MTDLEIVKNDNNLLDMRQASEYLNIKTSTLYALCMKKKIRVVKITRNNRFRRCDLDNFISKNMTEVQRP